MSAPASTPDASRAARVMLADRCGEFEFVEWQDCPRCERPCRIIHKALGTCGPCTSAEREAEESCRA
jgi:hypothetical protein